jgi:membrane protease YdiL (CAAX protease family)
LKGSRAKGVISYIVLAYGLAWILWEVPIRLLGASPRDPTLFQFVALPGAFAPAVAALIVRQWITREGFADSGLRPNLRKGWSYYLAGWLLPLPVLAVIVGLAWALSLARPDFTLLSGIGSLGLDLPPSAAPSLLGLALPFLLLVNALLAFPLLWGEEFGWRGYLQVRLFPERPLLAAVSTGIIWSLWHLPLNLRGYNFPGYPLLGMLVFTVSAVLLSIIFGWLRLASDSVWAPTLAHAATNAVGASTILLWFGGAKPLWVGYLGILAWVPLGAVCLWIVLTGRLQRAARASP